MIGSIYTLKDPRTDLVRYVGQTIVNPNNRYAQHMYQWKRSKKLTHVNSWIKALYDLNLKPVLEIIEDNINKENLNTKEIETISLFKSCGALLCNHTIGGAGSKGFKHSKESILKRLESISTSKNWKDKHLRHSQIMKDKYKNKELIPIVNRLSEKQKESMANAISEGRKKLIQVLEKSSNKILTFKGYQAFANYLGYKSPTVVRDFILNIRKSKLANRYEILENKNKFDVKSKNDKKKK